MGNFPLAGSPSRQPRRATEARCMALDDESTSDEDVPAKYELDAADVPDSSRSAASDVPPSSSDVPPSSSNKSVAWLMVIGGVALLVTAVAVYLSVFAARK